MAIPYLEIDAGAERKRFEVPEGDGSAEFILGRAPDCQMVIPSAAVSRRHARVRRREREVMIEDLGSSNGTFVNGEKISAAKALKDGDRISFGTVELIFVAPQPVPETDATMALSPGSAATVFAPAPKPAEEGTVAIPPPRESAARAAPKPPAPPPAEARAAESTSVRPLPKPPAEFADGRSPAPEPAQRPRARVTAEPSAPGILELTAIAIGSFIAVFAIGAMLVRYAF